MCPILGGRVRREPDVDAIPVDHMTARVMALNERARAALERGDRVEGERLAHTEPKGMRHDSEATKARIFAEAPRIEVRVAD